MKFAASARLETGSVERYDGRVSAASIRPSRSSSRRSCSAAGGPASEVDGSGARSRQRGLDALEPAVEPMDLLRRRILRVRRFCSRLERATNVLVIAAVMTVRMPIPKSITTAAMARPTNVVGTLSP